MPAIAAHGYAGHVESISDSIAKRAWDRGGASPISSTALGFLVPVFVILFTAPILCVFCVRRQGRRPPAVAMKLPKPPALNRTEAREKLRAVTEVSNIAGDTGTATQLEKKPVADSVSMLEKECAICLSTLHAPSPPEPAKLTPEPSASNEPPTKAASVKSLCGTDPEEILRLKICSHEFHAECLVSWFVLRKTSCPICRAVYNDDDEKPADEEALTPAAPALDDVRLPPAAGPAGYWHYFWTGRAHAAPARQERAVPSAVDGPAGAGPGRRFFGARQR